MHTILFSITNTYVFLYAKTVTKAHITAYMGQLGCGQL